MSRYPVLSLAVVICLQFSLAAYAADNFGRLFTTPSDRANLDHLRQTTKASAINQPAEISIDATPAATPAVPQPISMQGYVKRSDGKKGTVWVNNKPLQEGAASDLVEVGRFDAKGNEIPLKVPSTGKSIKLKAGQVYIVESGKIKEEGAHSRESREGDVSSGSIGGSQSLQDEAVTP